MIEFEIDLEQEGNSGVQYVLSDEHIPDVTAGGISPLKQFRGTDIYRTFVA